MQSVDQVIRHSLHSEVSLVNQVADYIIGSGGKRLRPALVLLSAAATGGIDNRHCQLAAIVEFIHTATLLHDDVVDASSLRRGRATANATYGNAASVLVGDFVYSRAFQMMVSLDNMRVMAILSEATNTIAEGEVLQLLNCHDADIPDQAYLQVIQYKTAKLFEAAARLGAVLNQQAVQNEQALASYGMHLGTAYQLIDDVLDFQGDPDAIGKNIGDDLAEGKPTLPLLIAMRESAAPQAAILRSAIESGGLDQLEQVLSIVQASGATEKVRELAIAEALKAKQCLETLGASLYRDALLQLATFSVERSH